MEVEEAVLADDDVVQKFIILLAAADDGDPIRGRTKLQKMMFMASKTVRELGEEGGFEPDNYGPYSEAVSEELEHLSSIGVLDAASGSISITPTGRRIAEELSKASDANTVTMIRSTKRLLNDLQTKEVLGYIYAAYPETTPESVEYERIRPDLESIIVGLIRKEKISSGHAAELLGKPLHYVMGLKKEAGIAYLH